MRKIISLICLLLPIATYADELQLQENAPAQYVVVKGDTLWDISAKFFKTPWKWPEIWGYNKESIADPHWIYPGDVVFLDPNTKTLHVGEVPSAPVSADADAGSAAMPEFGDASLSDSDAIKLSPRARVVKRAGEAIQTISINDIGPFLSRPLVIDDGALANSPVLVGTYGQRQLLGMGDVAYAENLPDDKGELWQIYRPDRTFIDPDTEEVLGHEVVYLGDATVEKFGKVASLRISKSVLEIQKGDRFAQSTTGFSSNYQPHTPDRDVSAKVIAIYGGVQQAGQHAVVTLNKGARDGLENGHVLAVYQKGDVIRTPGWFTPNIVLPDVRYGLLFVFRVFEKVSYALVMETTLPVALYDRVSTPE